MHDFQVFELLSVVEWFATQFDSLPELIEFEADQRVVGCSMTRAAGDATPMSGRDDVVV